MHKLSVDDFRNLHALGQCNCSGIGEDPTIIAKDIAVGITSAYAMWDGKKYTFLIILSTKTNNLSRGCIVWCSADKDTIGVLPTIQATKRIVSHYMRTNKLTELFFETKQVKVLKILKLMFHVKQFTNIKHGYAGVVVN